MRPTPSLLGVGDPNNKPANRLNSVREARIPSDIRLESEDYVYLTETSSWRLNPIPPLYSSGCCALLWPILQKPSNDGIRYNI